MRKNETLDDAFVRLVREELGIESGITRADAKFLGVFEHFYDDNFFDSEIDTHYVVLSYELLSNNYLINTIENEQHNMYLWEKEENVKFIKNVSQYTLNYFRG